MSPTGVYLASPIGTSSSSRHSRISARRPTPGPCYKPAQGASIVSLVSPAGSTRVTSAHSSVQSKLIAQPLTSCNMTRVTTPPPIITSMKRSPSQSSRCSTKYKSSTMIVGSPASLSPTCYRSQVEEAVVNATMSPPCFNATDYVQVGPYSGLQLNKDEEAKFSGPVPVHAYPINQDPNPDVIRKPSCPVKYKQQVATRYLKPPTPMPHGDLVIRELPKFLPNAPPVVLRQTGKRTCTPPPVVFREAPPAPPVRLPSEVIEVDAKPGPAPQRRVVIEKLPDEPCRPPNILIEKWLPWPERTRRVVYQRSCVPAPPPPKNLIVEWQKPDVQVEQVCVSLGVCTTDPNEYTRKYGSTLKQPCQMPSICPCLGSGSLSTGAQLVCSCSPSTSKQSTVVTTKSTVSTSVGTPLHAGSSPRRSHSYMSMARRSPSLRLEGDLDALRLVPDLDKYGLGKYKKYLQ